MYSESEVSQSCPTLCDPMDCSLPGSSVHWIFQATVLEWVANAFSNIYVYVCVCVYLCVCVCIYIYIFIITAVIYFKVSQPGIIMSLGFVTFITSISKSFI